jgi:hypothetical protein
MPVQADAGAGTVPGGGVARQELRAKVGPPEVRCIFLQLSILISTSPLRSTPKARRSLPKAEVRDGCA